ncbi:MAG: ABC transporter permease [Alphaproteobacteria bacterium]|nr:ABC transporter permease [Alphaproteobacteria bacterium]
MTIEPVAAARASVSQASVILDRAPQRHGLLAYINCFNGIVWREVLRFLHQRERFLSALVRPLVWLFIFAAGFRQVLGISIIPPYETYVLYETYVTPGLLGMVLLFNAMQSSLSMVYDRETGAMRTLLVSPFPRWFLLSSKLLGGVAVALLQVYTFLAIAYFWDIQPDWPALQIGFGQGDGFVGISIPPPFNGYITVLPAIVLAGLMLGALALFMSSVIRQLENFAGVMNFVIFPMFFASSALYPLWKIRESSPLLYEICWWNPFTHAVELIRFAFYGQLNLLAFAVVAGCLVAFLGAAIYAYNPSKGLIGRRGGPGGGPKG